MAYDPSPPFDDSIARPLKEYLIKFSVMNGKKSLTLDFKTFVESTGLDYNEGTYVSHPSPKAVKAELAKIVINASYLDKTPVLKTPFLWLGESCLHLSFSDLVTKLTSKSRQKYVSYPRFVLCALEVLLGAQYTQDENFGSLSSILRNSNLSNHPSKVTEIELTASMIAINNLESLVSPLSFSRKIKKGKSHTVSKPKPNTQGLEASGILPQNRKKAKTDKTTPEATKTPPTQSPRVKLLIPKIQRETYNSLLRDYILYLMRALTAQSLCLKVDQTQSTRLRYWSLTKNKGKTSSKEEPNTQTLLLTTVADVRALLLSDDELVEESNDDVFEAVLYAQVTEDNWEKQEEADVSYSDFKASIKEYYEENFDHRTQTDKLIQERMFNLDKINKARVDKRAKFLKSLNKISETLVTDSSLKQEMKKMAESNTTISGNITNLNELLINAHLPDVITRLNDFQSTLTTLSTQCASISESLKEEPDFNQRLLKAVEGYIQSSSRLTIITNSLKAINLSSFHQRITTIEHTQVTMQANISSIKGMMIKMLQAFNGMSSSTPAGSASILITTQPKVHASVKEGGIWRSKLLYGKNLPFTLRGSQCKLPNLEIALIEFSSRPSLADTTLVFSISNPETEIIRSSSGPVIDITPLKQPESLLVAPKADRGKGIATDETKEPTKKLVPASRKVCPNPDAPILKAAKEAKHLEMSMPELIKVVQEEATKACVDPRTLGSTKGGQEFKKIQDAEMKVLSREQAQKVKKAKELRQKRIDNYIWTTTSRLKPEPILDVKIYPNTKPAVLTVYRGNDRRNIEVYNPFKFGDFGLTKLDELGPIIEKKKNKIVGELMISLSKRYASLNKIPEELRIHSSLPAPRPKQGSAQLSRRKRKKMELEPKIRIPALECNMSLPKGVPFVNNMVIEEPEYGIFFIDVFDDKAFQRMSDINKVGVETLLTYLVMASNITTLENTRFCLKLRKLIDDHLDQEKLKSKKVKLALPHMNLKCVTTEKWALRVYVNNDEACSLKVRLCKDALISYITSGDDTQVVGSLSVLATFLQTKELDESMLDALGILLQRKQHKKLLVKALVGEDNGEEQLFASKNYTSKDGSDGELNVYLQRLKEFLADMADLQCLPPTVQPCVSGRMRENGDEELCSVYVPTNHLYIGDVFLVNSEEIIRPNLSIREGIAREASTAAAAPKCCLSNVLVLKEVSHYCLGTRMICAASVYFMLLMQDLMLPIVISYVNAAIDTTAIGFKRSPGCIFTLTAIAKWECSSYGRALALHARGTG
ncbi:hypothetical protein Tco_1219999, partial [Tanacetum coccineum]